MPRTVKVDIDGRIEREFTAALNELYSLFAPLTMASVARRVGVSEAAVSHWLHGRRAPQERSLARLYSEAAKVAVAAGRSVPYQLDQLIDMRHEVCCGSSACKDRRAARSVSMEGDRRNSGCPLVRGEGDRRNAQAPSLPAVGKRSPTGEVLALLGAGKRNEAFRILRHMSISASVVQLQSTVEMLLEHGDEDAARILLGEMAVHRSGGMVDMVIFASRAWTEVQS
ncbi:helix-turn-helix domain-containing protein [Streptomyces sp. NPDC087270]|uniref:helix-turn-helix domain-containing protein n=1 Tax=Streptomyces sp. NPDC087270 TaxID=3365774 RepID=UPI0037FE5A62